MLRAERWALEHELDHGMAGEGSIDVIELCLRLGLNDQRHAQVLRGAAGSNFHLVGLEWAAEVFNGSQDRLRKIVPALPHDLDRK